MAWSMPNENVRWVPPIDPWYKINFDGVTFTSNQSSEIGAIICGHVGRVEVALIKTLSNFYTIGAVGSWG